MPSPTTVVTGLRAKWGVSNCGQLMGTPTEAGLASIEAEGVYEHLAVGVLEEGYTLVYKTAPAAPITSSTTYINPAAELSASTATSVGTTMASL